MTIYLRPNKYPPNYYIILIETEFFKCVTFETLEYKEIDSFEYGSLELKNCIYSKNDLSNLWTTTNMLWKDFSIENIRIKLKVEKIIGKSACKTITES